MRHEHQKNAVEHGLAAVAAGKSLLIVSPTGSGKSYIAADLLNALPDSYLTVPNLEIAAGIWKKARGSAEEPDRETLERSRIYTIKRLYNLCMTGSVPLPKQVIIDESHHSVDNTNSVVWEAFGRCPAIGLTATAYRGCPSETAKLRERWPDVYKALSLKDAVARRIIARPDFLVWPLINDDLIAITNGDFVVRSVDGAVEDRLPDIIDNTRQFYANGAWTRPLMFRVSSVHAATMVTDALNAAGMPALAVTGGTRGRQDIFSKVVNRSHALVQIKVVGEGVDLPIRVLIDLSPSCSPLAWMQSCGRITRPTALLCDKCGGSFVGKMYTGSYESSVAAGMSTCPSQGCGAVGYHKPEPPPLYICTNHNLSRFLYLWEGLAPVSQVAAAQKAWRDTGYKPTRRVMVRALDLEGFGRFTVSAIPLANGTAVNLYALQTKDGLSQYAVLLHSCLPEPMYFKRTNALTGETATNAQGWTYSRKRYGRWKQIPAIPDCEGYTSIKPDTVTQPMLDWWRKPRGGAADCGLAVDFIPNAREFTILPILSNTGLKFTGEP